jgi:hypothetical protein
MSVSKQNYFNTLNEALESEELLHTWDGILMDGISYGETRTYYYTTPNGKHSRRISIFRETDGRYERPVHYLCK